MNPLDHRDHSQPEVDGELRALFASVPRPRLRTGFDRRLVRALAEDPAVRRARRRVTVVMASYWALTALLSGLILRGALDRLTGPALWVSAGGGLCLLTASILYWLLAAQPIRSWQRRKLIGR